MVALPPKPKPLSAMPGVGTGMQPTAAAKYMPGAPPASVPGPAPMGDRPRPDRPDVRPDARPDGDYRPPPALAPSGDGPAAAPGSRPGSASFGDSVRDQILALLTQDPNAIDPNSPALTAQRDAFNLTQARGVEQQRNALAERLAASGGASAGGGGALDAGIQQIHQGSTDAAAEFEGLLMARELQSRREQIAHALQLGTGLFTAEQQMALQSQLGHLDAEIRKLGIQTQGQLGLGQLNLGLLNTLAGNQQFYDNLGWDMGKFAHLMSSPFSVGGF